MVPGALTTWVGRGVGQKIPTLGKKLDPRGFSSNTHNPRGQKRWVHNLYFDGLKKLLVKNRRYFMYETLIMCGFVVFYSTLWYISKLGIVKLKFSQQKQVLSARFSIFPPNPLKPPKTLQIPHKPTSSKHHPLEIL